MHLSIQGQASFWETFCSWIHCWWCWASYRAQDKPLIYPQQTEDYLQEIKKTCNSSQAQGMCLESNALTHLSNGLYTLLLPHTLKHKVIKLIAVHALHHLVPHTAFHKDCSETQISALCTITPSQMFLQAIQPTQALLLCWPIASTNQQ